jgi:hypothetical protein
VKILEKAEYAEKNSWSFHSRCATCESLLEVEEQDITYEYYRGDQRDCSPGKEDYSYICPVCDEDNEVNGSEIPILPRKRIEDK